MSSEESDLFAGSGWMAVTRDSHGPLTLEECMAIINGPIFAIEEEVRGKISEELEKKG